MRSLLDSCLVVAWVEENEPCGEFSYIYDQGASGKILCGCWGFKPCKGCICCAQQLIHPQKGMMRAIQLVKFWICFCSEMSKLHMLSESNVSTIIQCTYRSESVKHLVSVHNVQLQEATWTHGRSDRPVSTFASSCPSLLWLSLWLWLCFIC
jgi:hypothetical protein